MSIYNLCGNDRTIAGDKKKSYIDDWPKLHGNITQYINNTKGTTHISNYEFVEFQNDQDHGIYKRICSYIGVVPIRDLLPSDELWV